jgi:Flp pilus assembly pilin Flp
MLSRIRRNQGGQDLIEYALLLALVALAGGAMIPPVGAAVSSIFTKAMSVLARFGG